MVDQSKAVVPYLRKFDEDELKLLGRMLAQVAPKATGEEKAMFLYRAQKKGLDPFNNQIYLVPRYTAEGLKHSVQVSIDGLRLMAQRSGKYAGQIGPHWCGKDRVWRDVWVEDEPPVAARVGVLRHDFKEPLYSVALFESYKQTKKDGSLNVFWQKYGPHMLGKTAEALSIRRAFPEETSGYYIPEEMGNPEITHVAEVEQDNDAPLAESELVTESTTTNGATEQSTSNSQRHATNGATKPLTSHSTDQATNTSPMSKKPPVVNPSVNNTTQNTSTKPPTSNKTAQEGENKNSEGQSTVFTPNSHDAIKALKNKAIELQFIQGKDRTELAEMWRKRKRAVLGAEIPDEELSSEQIAKMDEAIDRYVAQRSKPEPLTNDAMELANEYKQILGRKVDGAFASEQDAQRSVEISEAMYELGYQMNAERKWQKINKVA